VASWAWENAASMLGVLGGPGTFDGAGFDPEEDVIWLS